ncbi:E3 ubiquitin-protein ligase NEURL3 [Kryptolebias marmoratus]|uniref:E3 ubiquitin-protein ligase NEURL3-like n=1 Tax=Kryptolebias marmoratus TaxID=37003 RepID=A0A3Q3EZF4_KRYMA|nr:E3 ubiquitin-protein ligase NEURL3 [Kryptolebias marmoratus]
MRKDNRNSAVLHKCGRSCLGPLAFHGQAVGNKIRLSDGGRRADRDGNTFKDGLVFSSRPVRANERIRVRVQTQVGRWKGALRVGFTNLPPSGRSLPLPCMAIPNLTNAPSHWAAPVRESLCHSGSVLEFWVTATGKLCCSANKRDYKLLSGVDLSLPLWAMIDVYGQTCSVLLLGSEKKDWLSCRTSCPVPEASTIPYDGLSPDLSSPGENWDDGVSCINMDIPAGSSCVVCMVREPTITLPCAHRCLCHHCTSKVVEQFGTCPLCRHDISPSFLVS